jgi:hypothetical protein
LAVLLATSVTPRAVLALTPTWTNAAGNALWADPLNWSTNAVPTFGDSVTFPAGLPGGAATITVPDGAAATGVELWDHYTLTGGTLELHAPGGASGWLRGINASNVTVDTRLVGSTNLSLGGNAPGGLTLTADNTFTGQITPSGTGVRLVRDATFGPTSNLVFFYATLVVDGTFSSARTFAPGTSQAGFNVTAGNTFTLLAGLKSFGVLDKTGPGTLVLTQPVQTDNPGFETRVQTNILQGTVRAAHPDAFGNTGATSTFSEPVRLQGGTLEIANINFPRSIYLNAGDQFIVGTGRATLSGTINQNGYPRFSAPTPSDSLTIAGGALTSNSSAQFASYVSGAGRVIAGGPSNRPWSLNGGTLQLNHPQALKLVSPQTSFTINNGSTLAVSGCDVAVPLAVVNGHLASGDAPGTFSGDITLFQAANTVLLSAPGTASHDLTLAGNLSFNSLTVTNPAGQPASLVLTRNALPNVIGNVSVRPGAGLTSAPSDKVSSVFGDRSVTLTGATLRLLSNADTTYAGTVSIGYVNSFDGPAPAASSSLLHLDQYDATNAAPRTLRLASLRLPLPSHTLKVTAGHGFAMALDRLLISNFARLDLTDVSTTVTSELGSAYATIIDAITHAHHDGHWDATGLTSSLAANDPTGATAVGYRLAGGALHIRYTWTGDTNLDGTVDGADRAAQVAGLSLAPGTAAWSDGDVNFDRTVDADDFLLFALGAVYGTADIATHVPESGSALGLAWLSAHLPCRRRRVAG